VFGIHESLAMLAKHGYIVLFAWVTAEQLGAPVPAIPVLVAAGVVSATGQFSLLSALLLSVLGCLIGDVFWYVIGRRSGSVVLTILCKLSLNPESCVRRSSEFLSRHGNRALVLAKFIPGIGRVAVPLAGSAGITPWPFFFYDFLGSLLYAAAYLVTGRLLGDSIDRLAIFAGSLRSLSLVLAMVAAVAILGWRFYRKRQFQKDVSLARITPEEVLQLIEKQQRPYIVDLRHPLDMLTDARVIPGAIRMTPDELSAREGELPRDREIILYCT
jgi:membrane protein DedA with SNARE-associated domain